MYIIRNTAHCAFLCVTLFFLISLSYQQDVTEELEVVEFVESNNETDPSIDGETEDANISSSTDLISTTESIDQLYQGQTRSLEELYHFYLEKHLDAALRDKANDILILEDGDPFSVLATDVQTGCMFIDDDDVPLNLDGTQSYKQDCDPNAGTASPPSTKCQLYVVSRENKDPKSKACLKPTHLICDPTLNKCACGNEGVMIPDIRFQFGEYEGKDHKDGRCFVRPTFDYIPGIECSPGTIRKELAVEEEADSIPICACESDACFDRFDSSDKDWWVCGTETYDLFGTASLAPHQRASTLSFLFTVIYGGILLSFQ